jgi:ribose 5-phosphate isomerase A
VQTKVARESGKRDAAHAALQYVRPGEPLGVGSGSTVQWFIRAMAKADRRPSMAVAASRRTQAALAAAGIPAVTLAHVSSLGVYVDGADEIDPEGRTIKGAGGAMTREKVLASAAATFVCIADTAKVVDALGDAPIPLEVLEFALPYVLGRLAELGGVAGVRDGFTTDDGNPVVDCRGLALADDPEGLELELEGIPGVVGCGLFARRRVDVRLMGGL